MLNYTPEHLPPYERPKNYIGATHHGTYVVYSTHRDADSVTRSNWRVLQKMTDELDGVYTASANHWAVGWVEVMYVDPTEASEQTLQMLDEIVGGLQDYPLISDEDHSELEWDEAWEWWERAGTAERVELCQGAGVSVFMARHDAPQDDSGRLFEWLRRD